MLYICTSLTTIIDSIFQKDLKVQEKSQQTIIKNNDTNIVEEQIQRDSLNFSYQG